MDQELKVYIALVQFPAPMLGSSTTTYNSSSGTIILAFLGLWSYTQTHYTNKIKNNKKISKTNILW